MKILLASDIHGSIAAARLIVKLCSEGQAHLVVLLGDLLCCGSYSSEYDGLLTAEILSEISLPVLAVRGNCDSTSDLAALPWYAAESAWLPLKSAAPFLVIHGHQMRDVDRVAGYGREIDVICGHTHVAMAERGPRGRRWNPGSLGDPQLGDPATYGLYDDGVFRVLSVDGQLVCEDRLP